MGQAEAGNVTRLLRSWSRGEKEALNKLVPFVYRELRRLAAAYLRRERTDHTLQPTGLVHEAYLRLIDQTQIECRDRATFFIVAANLMRQILVDHARRRRAAKRGGGNHVVLDEAAGAFRQDTVDLVELDRALERLAQLDARQGRIVELRFFLGLTEDEIAEILEVSAITVKRDWRIAKAVLRMELGCAVRDHEGRR